MVQRGQRCGVWALCIAEAALVLLENSRFLAPLSLGKQDRSALAAVLGQQLALGGCCKIAGHQR